jgi:integrase/recombinase XerD
MVRPAVHPLRVREETLHDLRDEFLLRCQAKNLSARTIQWYEERTRLFVDWCEARRIERAAELTTSVLEEYVIELRASGLAPNTVRGYAQILKTMARLGHRKGLIPVDITTDFEMPKVPQLVIPTFSDEQLRALLKQPDARTWVGVRDRAILLTFLDTLVRVSELVGLNAEDVDLRERTMRVMGKGAKERDLPLGQAATQALRRYKRALADLRPGDPFFISRYAGRITRKSVHEMVARYGKKAGIEGVRCSPHTLRHTGAKRFILAGGDVFTLQKLLGHTTLFMVRRYVEMTTIDVNAQHERFSPADSLFRGALGPHHSAHPAEKHPNYGNVHQAGAVR